MNRDPSIDRVHLDKLDRLAALHGLTSKDRRRIRKENDEMLRGARERIERSRILLSRLDGLHPPD